MRRALFCFLCLSVWIGSFLYAQEVLLPLQYGPAAPSGGRHAKGEATALTLPFFDDFANYEGIPMPDRWISAGGWVDKAFAANPPTVGMLTLDAINADGRLYADGSSTLPFPADTVTSRPLRLDSLQSPVARRISTSDSVAISFFYLPGGGSGDMWMRSGDTPETADSLVLEFYDSDADQWNVVWSAAGTCVDSLLSRTGRDWQYAYVPINDDKYLRKDFQFRFRNYCSLDNIVEAGYVGNCDQWHIDYVYLDYNRTRGYYYTRDVAFVAPAPSLLRNYQAMPARQFRTSEMASHIDIAITNRFQEELSAHYLYYEDNGYLTAYDGGVDNIGPYLFTGSYQTAASQAQPTITGSFPEDGIPRCYHITHIVTEGVGGDAFAQNDTLRFDQHIEDYYAYDDGSAENGYGVYASSGSAFIASRFSLNQADSLSAISICFNRTRGAENEQMMFYICVWDDDHGQPGRLLYRDASFRRPQFNGVNKSYRYILDKIVNVEGIIYIGIEQVSSGIINIGMDRNNDASQHTFYNVGGVWSGSFLAGALMMRPYFGVKATTGILQAHTDHKKISVYPNPAVDILSINGAAPGDLKQLFSLTGNKIIETTANQMQVSHLPAGVYLLRILSSGNTYSTKVIIQP